MTDLDRYKQVLHDISKCKREIEWANLKCATSHEMLEFKQKLDNLIIEEKSLYEKLKKAEELSKHWTVISIRCECGHWDFEHPLFVYGFDKTPEKPCKNCKCNNFKKSNLETEIQQLKEELKITQEAFRECSQSEMSCRESLPLARKKIDELYAQIRTIQQDSKTNAEIIEKFTKILGKIVYEESDYKDYIHAVQELQSILKETK